MPIDLRALALLSAGGPTYNLTASTIDFSTGRTTLASAVTTFASTGSVDAACGAAHDATRGRFVVPEVGALAELADTTGEVVARHTVASLAATVGSFALAGSTYVWLTASEIAAYDLVTGEAFTIASLNATPHRCVSDANTTAAFFATILRDPTTGGVTNQMLIVDVAARKLANVVTLDTTGLGGLQSLAFDGASGRLLATTATQMESGYDPHSWRVSSVDAASGALSLISYIDVANASMWFHGGCGYTAGAGELFLFLAGRVDKSKRVLARVKLDTATVDHVALDTSFSPAAAGGYQGPEWAAPAVA